MAKEASKTKIAPNETDVINVEEEISPGYFHIIRDGMEIWRLNNKLHREDGPALITSDGAKYWYINGIQHRVGKPAIEYTNKDCIYYYNGELHNPDGWASRLTIDEDTVQYCYYINGQLHREDGPAVVNINKFSLCWKGRSYWFNGKKIEVDNDEDFKKMIKNKAFL